MTQETFGFDAFARKWLPPPPAWKDAAAARPWGLAASEGERCRAYMEAMQQAGGDSPAFRRELVDKLKRDAAAGVPILALLDGLLREPEVGGREAVAVLFQRVFGVPASRARFIASWQPSNRRPEALRVLERVALCVEDARRAGLWSPPPGR